jgi:hypothetical protein
MDELLEKDCQIGISARQLIQHSKDVSLQFTEPSLKNEIFFQKENSTTVSDLMFTIFKKMVKAVVLVPAREAKGAGKNYTSELHHDTLLN